MKKCGNCGTFLDPPDTWKGRCDQGVCLIMKDIVPENGYCGDWISRVEE